MAPDPPETAEQEAARLGVSIRHVYRLRAREKAGLAEWLEPTAGPPPEPDDLDPFDFPYMELVVAIPADPRHPWCQIDPPHEFDPDAASEDWGRFHLGRGIRSLTGGHIDLKGERPEEPKSRGKHVTAADREQHVVWVQRAPEAKEA